VGVRRRLRGLWRGVVVVLALVVRACGVGWGGAGWGGVGWGGVGKVVEQG